MWNQADIAARWAGWNERIDRVRGVIRPFRKRIALFFAIVGPGLIVSNVDNDAGGIYTYAQSGAQFGNTVLWTLIPMTLVLYVSLEMCSRLGAYTGKGLSDLIREEFGFRVTFFLMAIVLVVNLGNVMAEFTGVFWATDVLGINRDCVTAFTPAAFDAVRANHKTVRGGTEVQCRLCSDHRRTGRNDDRAVAAFLFASGGGGKARRAPPVRAHAK